MEVQDLFICSQLVDNFTVFNTNDMGCDHFPISAEIKYRHDKPANIIPKKPSNIWTRQTGNFLRIYLPSAVPEEIKNN